MKRLAALLTLALLAFPFAARAEECQKPDDSVVLSLSSENWVTTQTARVILGVEAAVTGEASGATRAEMAKAVDSVIKAEWKLTAFSRMQDQTGMERWSAQYETRLEEKTLSGLADKAKKASRAGLQISVAAIDFSPTLDERQAALSETRAKLYRRADEELALLNKSLPGRSYRISSIDFSGGDAPVFEKMARPMMAMARAGGAMEDSASQPMERAEKIAVTARIVFAATPNLGK